MNNYRHWQLFAILHTGRWRFTYMSTSDSNRSSTWKVILVDVFICCVVYSPKNDSFSHLITFHSIYNTLNNLFTYPVYHGRCICFASHYYQFRSLHPSHCINMLAWLCSLGSYTIILTWMCWPRIWPRGPNMQHHFLARHPTDEWHLATVSSRKYFPMVLCLRRLYHHILIADCDGYRNSWVLFSLILHSVWCV